MERYLLSEKAISSEILVYASEKNSKRGISKGVHRDILFAFLVCNRVPEINECPKNLMSPEHCEHLVVHAFEKNKTHCNNFELRRITEGTFNGVNETSFHNLNGCHGNVTSNSFQLNLHIKHSFKIPKFNGRLFSTRRPASTGIFCAFPFWQRCFFSSYSLPTLKIFQFLAKKTQLIRRKDIFK